MTFRDLLPWYIISHFNCGFLWIQKKPASICQHNFPMRKKRLRLENLRLSMTANWRVRNFFISPVLRSIFENIVQCKYYEFFKVDNGWHEGIVYDCLWTAIHIFISWAIFYAINNWRPQFEINDNFSTNLEKMPCLPNPFM